MRGKQLTWPNKSHSHYEEGFHHGKGFKNWSGLLKEVRDHNLKIEPMDSLWLDMVK